MGCFSFVWLPVCVSSGGGDNHIWRRAAAGLLQAQRLYARLWRTLSVIRSSILILLNLDFNLHKLVKHCIT